MSQHHPIAVTGMGAVTALGAGTNSLWTGLLDGRRPFAPVRAFDASTCRVNLAAEVSVRLPNEGNSRAADLGVMAAREALLESSRLPERDRIGLVVGSTGSGDHSLELALAGAPESALFWQRCLKGQLADDIATILHLGPSRQVINTACSSGAIAIALARDGLLAGDYDMALAIGCDELGSVTYSGFSALRALDTEPCRPFDKNRHGMTIGEGAGCLVLERLEDALSRNKRIRAIIAGAGLSCDSHHLTAPDPDGRGASLAFEKALAEANLVPSDVGFINAHGTGTPLNDAAEIAGIERVLCHHATSCLVHSVKASTGHCMGAAGTIEAIASIMSLETGLLPATAGLCDCEFEGRVDCVKSTPRRFEAKYGVSNSFGFGGNNASLVIAHAVTAS